MKKDKWIWMPHPAHFICARDCRFFLATCVGKYIVSTVGEYFPDSSVRKIFAESRKKVIQGIGDEWDIDYMRKIGFEEIGYGRKYETMVFRAVRAKDKRLCCPWRIKSGENVDFRGYNSAEEAYKGHLKLCEKWSDKKTAKLKLL